MKKLIILGSTGSIGTQAIDIVRKNPDKYKNLQVRVCGWNILWNNLSKAEQDAYILRSENVQ